MAENPEAIAQFTCRYCETKIPLRLGVLATAIGCPKCRRVYLKHDNFQNEQSQFVGHKDTPYIPVGTKGIIKDIEYAVVGYLYVRERSTIYRWSEYVLYNREKGYAFLSEYEGHWAFFQYVEIKKFFPGSIYYGDREYNVFNKYTSESLHAEGEFPWDILQPEQVVEYVSPPYGLNYAKCKGSVDWTQGEYVKPKLIREAFKLEKKPPHRSGTGALQPFGGGATFTDFLKPTGIALGILFLLQIVFSVLSERQLLFSKSFYVPPTANATVASALQGPEIDLPDGFTTRNLEFDLFSEVNNSWFAMGVTLIHQASGKEYDFETGVEYYYGYTDGEHWKEGSQRSEKILSAMPSGKYTMLIYPYTPSPAKSAGFTLTVYSDVTIWSNFWILALAIILFPIVQGIREHWHDRMRWSNSDYSPYGQDE